MISKLGCLSLATKLAFFLKKKQNVSLVAMERHLQGVCYHNRRILSQSARKKTAGRRVKGMLYERNEDSKEWIDLSNSFCIQGGVGALKML